MPFSKVICLQESRLLQISTSYQSEEKLGDVIHEWGMVYLRMAVVTPALSVFLDPFAETAQLFVKYLLNSYSLAE